MNLLKFYSQVKDSKVGKNFLSLSIWQLTNNLIPIITMPYIIRVVGPEKFGAITLIQAFHYYFIILVDYGFSTTAVREIAMLKNNDDSLSIIFNKVLFTKLVLTIASFIIVSMLVILVPKFRLELVGYFLGFSIVFGQAFFPTWFFQGVETMKYITYLNIVSKLIFITLILFFIRKEQDYQWVIAFQGIGIVFASVVGIYLILSKYHLKIFFPGWNLILNELKSGFSIFISNFSVTAYYSTNYLLIGFFGDDRSVGIFGIAEKIMSLILRILSMFSQAVFPKVCFLITKSHDELRSFWRKVVIPFAILVFSICIFIALSSRSIVNIVSGENQIETAHLLSLIIWVPFIVFFNIPFTQTLLAYNYKKQVMKILTVASICSILLSFYLVNRFLIYGAAFSLLFTEMGIVVALLIALEKRMPILISNKIFNK